MDIVERLRGEAKDWDCVNTFDEVDMHGLLSEAAAEIERLRAELAARDGDIADWLRCQGINRTECDFGGGWWETSTGAEFGERFAKAIETGEYRSTQKTV